jgi:hypothetical protein
MLSVEAMYMEKAAKDWDRGVGIRMDQDGSGWIM